MRDSRCPFCTAEWPSREAIADVHDRFAEAEHDAHHRERLERDLNEAWTMLGRITLFVAQHGLTDEWQEYHRNLRAKDAAEAARAALHPTEQGGGETDA